MGCMMKRVLLGDQGTGLCLLSSCPVIAPAGTPLLLPLLLPSLSCETPTICGALMYLINLSLLSGN